MILPLNRHGLILPILLEEVTPRQCEAVILVDGRDTEESLQGAAFAFHDLTDLVFHGEEPNVNALQAPAH